jgi:DNA-binding NtrC family response regulator
VRPISLDARLGELERSLITWALKACDGNASRAAKLLQIERSTLQDRMKRYRLDPCSASRALPSDLAASA